MKKTTSKSKSTTKSKTAVKSRRTTVAKASALKKSRKAVASKQTTQRKGIKHHATRIYRLTPKFVHGMVAGAFVGVVLVTSLGITGGVSANPQADACIRTLEFAPGNGGHIQNNGNNLKVMVKLDNGCGNRNLELKAYYAPDTLGGGSPNASQQVLFSKTALTVKVKDNDHWTAITTKALDSGCFYQADLVDTTHTQPGQKNDMVVFRTGGNHDCTPTTPPTPPTPPTTPTYSCDSIGLTPGEGRKVTISTLTFTGEPTTLTGATIDWSDGPAQNVSTPLGQSHTFLADGNYTVKVTLHFTYGGTHTVDSNSCQAPISFTAVPNSIYVCEISTKRILNIDETLYGTDRYPLERYTKDLSKCVVVTAPPATLANTGPGAILIIFGLAILGGYAFHMRHRHVQRKKPAHRTPHHAK
jgi:hypothetical protein